MGGLYATRLALEEPNKVQCLVNVTSSPKFIGDELWPGVPKEVFINFYKSLSVDADSSLRDFIALQTNKQQNSIELGCLPSKEGLALGMDILKCWDLREALKHLSVPTCYMFGRLDPITPIKTMNVMQQSYPNFNYILFNKAAHMPFLSHQELFIDEFLRLIK
jgi:pimeloyl-[acyl-carrier protein] methyl ester esterase